ncbi:MAG: hypothetical protein NC215_06105 [Ruminococcus sp.]|nr:hypothetical protein [Ruminococcus sp.]MCM1392133.1 hypothetical protein [Ruminococcus sp.]
MGTSLASMHVLGMDGEYVQNVIKKNAKSVLEDKALRESKLIRESISVMGEDIFRNHYFGMKSNKAYSIFCDKFGLESINDDACEYFGFINSPVILTYGLFDEDALQLSIIKDVRIISEIMLTEEDNGYDFEPCWKNCKAFEWYFGITQQQIEDAVDTEDLFEAGERLSELFGLPLNNSYDYIEEERDRFDVDEFVV